MAKPEPQLSTYLRRIAKTRDENTFGTLVGFGIMNGLLHYRSEIKFEDQRIFAQLDHVYKELEQCVRVGRNQSRYDMTLREFKRNVEGAYNDQIFPTLENKIDSLGITIIEDLRERGNTLDNNLQTSAIALNNLVQQRGDIRGKRNIAVANYQAIIEAFLRYDK